TETARSTQTYRRPLGTEWPRPVARRALVPGLGTRRWGRRRSSRNKRTLALDQPQGRLLCPTAARTPLWLWGPRPPVIRRANDGAAFHLQQIARQYWGLPPKRRGLSG